MLRIDIDKLQPGMALAKAITNEAGMVMLNEGAVLTDSLINRLGRMEVRHVFIEGDAPGAKSAEEMLSDLDLRFQKTENERYMDIIKRVIKTRIEEVYK